MLEAARAIASFTEGIDLEAYRADLLRRRGVEREPEILGEAASRVSQNFRDAHPDIPWRSIVGQRNILIHQYGAVDDERVWRAASTQIPRMIEHLERLVPPPPPDRQ